MRTDATAPIVVRKRLKNTRKMWLPQFRVSFFTAKEVIRKFIICCCLKFVYFITIIVLKEKRQPPLIHEAQDET
jgi:hypothetical protein